MTDVVARTRPKLRRSAAGRGEPTARIVCTSALTRVVLAVCILFSTIAVAGLDGERYKKLTEDERYQMNQAQRLFNAGNYIAAQNEFEKYIALFEDSDANSYVQYMIGECQRRRKNRYQAIKDFTGVLDYFPDSPDAPAAIFGIAVCRQDNGEVTQAMQLYEQMEKKYPDYIDTSIALWKLAEFDGKRGRQESRHQRITRIVENFKYADLRRRSKESRETYKRAVWHVVWANLSKNDAVAAAEALQKFYSRRNAVWWVAHNTYHRGVSLKRQGRAKDAKKWLLMARNTYATYVKEFPNERNTKEAMAMIARSVGEAGDLQGALAEFAKYFEVYPDDDDGRVQVGRTLEQWGMFEKARAEYAKMRNKWRGYMEIARSFEREKKLDDMALAYDAALDALPKNAAATRWETFRSYERLRKYDKCLEVLTILATQHPGHAREANYRIGGFRQRRGEYTKAIQAYRTSEKEPDSLYRIGECQTSLGKYKQARQTYQQIMGFFKGQEGRALQRIVGVYEAEGNSTGAIKTLKLICDRYPKGQESSWAHQRLETRYAIPYTGGGVKEGAKPDRR